MYPKRVTAKIYNKPAKIKKGIASYTMPFKKNQVLNFNQAMHKGVKGDDCHKAYNPCQDFFRT